MNAIELQKKWMRLYELVYRTKSKWTIQPRFGRAAALVRLDKLGFELCITLVHRGFIPGTDWHMKNLSPWTMCEPAVMKGLADALEAIDLTRHPERYLSIVGADGRLHHIDKPNDDVLYIAELFYQWSSECRDFLPEARIGMERWRGLMKERRDQAEEIRVVRRAAEITANPLGPWEIGDDVTYSALDRVAPDVRERVFCELAKKRDARERATKVRPAST